MSLWTVLFGMSKKLKTQKMGELMEEHPTEPTTVEEETTVTTYEVGFRSGETKRVKATKYKEFKGKFFHIDRVSGAYWSGYDNEIELKTEEVPVLMVEDDNVEYIEPIKEETLTYGARVDVEQDFSTVRAFCYVRTAGVSYNPEVSLGDETWVNPRPDIPQE